MLPTPTVFNSETFNVSVGPHHMCAIRGMESVGTAKKHKDDKVWQSGCWGRNIYGELDVESYNFVLDQKLGQGYTCMIQPLFDREYTSKMQCSVACQGKFVHSDRTTESEIFIPKDIEHTLEGMQSGFSHFMLHKPLPLSQDSLQHSQPNPNPISELADVLLCLGSNDFGECSPPAAVQPAAPLLLSAGWHHSCVLTSSAHVACWGSNRFQQQRTPRAWFRDVFYSLHSGFEHNCATTLYGYLCWGRNDHQQAEGRVVSGVNVLLFEAGGHHNCLTYNRNSKGLSTIQTLSETDYLTCWGQNKKGQCDVPERFRY